MDEGVQVLHVDDEQEFADMAATALERENDRFTVETAFSAADGLNRLADDVDCVISDYEMPRQTGIEFLEAVREEYPDLPFILFTGKGSEEVASDAISAGVTDYLQKKSGLDQFTVLANRITNAVSQTRTERRLEQKNARLSVLFERFPEPTVAYVYEDDVPQIAQVNEAFCQTFGYEAGEVIGASIDDKIVPPARQAEADQIDERVSDGELVDEILRRQAADGERLFRFRNITLPEDDAIDGYAIYADVTALREREKQLQAEQQRFQTLFDQLTDPMVEVEYDGLDPIVTDANPAFEETFGYDVSTIVGESLHDLIVPDDKRAGAEEISSAARENERVGSREVTRQAADGLRTFSIESQVYGDGSSGFVIYTDITDRKRREQALNELHDATRQFMDAQSKQAVADRAVETARTVLDQPINGLWLYDEDEDMLQPVSLTATAHELLGEQPVYTRGESLSWTAFEDGELRVYDDVRTESERLNAETTIRSEIIVPLGDHGVMNIGSTAAGNFSEIDISLARVLGKSVEAALTRADREQQLRTQQAELERQNDRLEQFASVVSHDLRNPLQVAITRLDLLAEEYDDDNVDAIDRALSRIDHITADVLWLARQGQDIGEVEPVDLHALVRETWEITADRANRSELLFDDLDESDRIEADGDRLRQLLENLLGNAVEHGLNEPSVADASDDAAEHGGPGVTVTVGTLEDGFYIADDGPGIPEDERDTVFEAGHSTADQGTGFGLNIVQQIVDAHGWEIHVTESAGGGARFEVTGVTTVG
jgi:PAS domain S-box-containing protein